MTAPGMNHAQTLRIIAGLVEDGCPAPIGINLSDAGVSVQVLVEHLGDWLGAVDVCEPSSWTHSEDLGYSRAGWPAGSFDSLPFSLICVSHPDFVAS